MATIIFDLDDTLMDTSKFKELLWSFFEQHGIPTKTIEATYKSHRAKYSGNPGFLEHIEELKTLGYKIPDEEIEKFLNTDLRPFLKGNVEETIKKLQNKKHRLILLTRGIDYFQNWKIRKAGLDTLFNRRTYVCEDKKENELFYLHGKEKAYFINDSIEEIQEVRKAFPNLRGIAIQSPKTNIEKAKKEKIRVLNSIENLLSIVK